MRFGISATSLILPKNLRTRLRPVNVCCAIVASHFAAYSKADPPERDWHRPRVENPFSSGSTILVGKPASDFPDHAQNALSSSFLNLRTQNDVRSAATLCPS